MWQQKIGEWTLGQIVRNSELHFLLGFSVAFLAYWLTLTIFRGFGADKRRERSIRRYSLGLALSLSIVSHVLEDYWLGKF